MSERGKPSSGARPGVTATVIELLPQATYRVELESRQRVLAHAAGAGKNFVRVRPGDRVLVELSAHDRTRGRIVEWMGTDRGS